MRKSHHLTFSAGEPAGAKRHVIGIATGMSEIDAAIPVARVMASSSSASPTESGVPLKGHRPRLDSVQPGDGRGDFR
jgi:hypothetical protein